MCHVHNEPLQMNFQRATGKTIQQAFDEYHKNNPKVYERFKEYAIKSIKNGKSRISFKLILNVIRWSYFMETKDETQVLINGKWVTFRINDAYSSRYARLFIQEFPEHTEKIEMRELRTL
jgi:hypothetical protein